MTDVFDLDAFAAESKHEPFKFTLAGKTFSAVHVEDLDYRDAGVAGDPKSASELLEAALGSQAAAFRKAKLSAGAFGELTRRWLEFSGVKVAE